MNRITKLEILLRRVRTRSRELQIARGGTPRTIESQRPEAPEGAVSHEALRSATDRPAGRPPLDARPPIVADMHSGVEEAPTGGAVIVPMSSPPLPVLPPQQPRALTPVVMLAVLVVLLILIAAGIILLLAHGPKAAG